MPREKPAPYVVREKKKSVPESGPDRVLFDSLLAIVDRKLAANQKNLGEPKDADAHRRRIDEAVELALNSKDLSGARWKTFQSYLLAELGKRGGEQASAKRSADEELDHALRQDYVARQMKLHAADLVEHEKIFGENNGLDDTTSEKEAKE